MTSPTYSLLLVDDEELNRDALSRRLRRQQYQVTLAASGKEALELIRQQEFDLVLLDVMMPEVDGLEVLMTIREMFDRTELPVIMVTARDQSGDVVAALQMGANDYVSKPVNFPVLLARIQSHLLTRTKQLARSTSGGSAISVSPARPPSDGPPASDKPSSPPTSTASGRSGCRSNDIDRATANRNELVPAQENGPPTITGYEVLSELGRGGMGVVYKARHQRMNRLVALKVINRDYLLHSDAVRRFYQEVQAAAQLNHQNIVLAYDAGQVGTTHYLAMEYVEGFDLARLVKRNGPLPIAQVCAYIRQAAQGLQHAHERGLVHRDIKPSNLFLSLGGDTPSNGSSSSAHYRALSAAPEGTIKILDMGLALLHQPAGDQSPANPLTQEGRWVGTPDFMAPEQAISPHRVDIRADLYSLGCTFYFLLAGRVPFPELSPMEKILKHSLSEPTPLEQLRPDVPGSVAAVVRRLLAKRPEGRYAPPPLTLWTS